MVVCHCHRVTHTDVQSACAEQASLRCVAQRTGAATGCGGCVSHLRELIAAAAGSVGGAARWETAVRAG